MADFPSRPSLPRQFAVTSALHVEQLTGRAEGRTRCEITMISDHSCARPVADNVWPTAPQFCGPKISWLCRMPRAESEVFGLGQRDQLGLEDPARINAERLGLSARGRWRFQGQLRRRPEPTTEDWNSHGSCSNKF